MAKKAARNDTAWKGFANVPFNAEARAAFEKWDTTANAVYQEMEEMLGAGYRVTFSYDKTNAAYQCSVTCQNERDANNGYTLTSRGPSWYDALMVAVFKHVILTEREWPLSEKTQGDKWG